MHELSNESNSLSEQVYLKLRELIITGEMKPGTRLLVLEIAKEFNVSQAPVREAIERLKQESLLIGMRNKGSIVSDVSREEMEEVYKLRGLIEGFVVGEAMSNMQQEDFDHLYEIYLGMVKATQEDNALKLIQLDMDFHEFFYKKSRNQVIFDVWNNTIKTKLMRFNMITNKMYYPDIDKVANNHLILLETLKTGNKAEAQQSFEEHMTEVWGRIGKSSRPPSF